MAEIVERMIQSPGLYVVWKGVLIAAGHLSVPCTII